MFHQIQKPSKTVCFPATVYDAPILQLRNLQEQAPGLSTWFYQAVNIQGVHASFGQERNQNFIYCALIPAAITWMFPKIGVGPQNGEFIMENLIKMDDLGVPLVLETPTSERLIFLCDRMFIGKQMRFDIHIPSSLYKKTVQHDLTLPQHSMQYASDLLGLKDFYPLAIYYSNGSPLLATRCNYSLLEKKRFLLLC